MEVVVRSRSQAKAFDCDVPWACISIATEVGDWPKITGVKRLGHLPMAFADADDQVWAERLESMQIEMFQEKHADQILDFVNDMWDQVDLFMVHCEAGQSRSPAVAAAIVKIRGQDDSDYFRNRTPNAFVYRVMLETAFSRGEYGPVDKNDIPDSTGEFNRM
jgi:predicted protein tyrosine phosphatase